MTQKKKTVLVVGSGAREHALSWRISESPLVDRVITAPGNPGTEEIGTRAEIAADDVDRLVALALKERVDLVVVGPEAPLVLGLADRLREHGIAVFGPSRAAAELEGSKAFSKHFMKRHAIPTAEFGVFEEVDSALAYLETCAEPPVIKADGLCAGKGVVVAGSMQEAREAVIANLRDRQFGDASAKIVIEEKLPGEEVSYHVISDGTRYVALAPAQDHKRLLDGDRGPNTGGMGAYSPVPMVTEEIEQKILTTIVAPTLRGLSDEGRPFQGALFVGLMIERGEPRVLEYNVRFGDPECEVLMARLRGDVVPLLWGAAIGDLAGVSVDFGARAALAVVLAAGGYPHAPEKGQMISGLHTLEKLSTARVFHAGTRKTDAGWITHGGRVLTVTADGATLDEAAARAYAAADAITFEGKQMRRDIGFRGRRGALSSS